MLRKNTIVFSLSKAFQKHFSYHPHDAKTPFFAIPATPKHFSYNPRYAKTLLLLIPQCQIMFLAIPAMPEHFPCHLRHAKALILPSPPSPPCPNTLSHHYRNAKTFVLAFPLHHNTFIAIPAASKNYTCTPGHNLATLDNSWLHLATAGHPYQPTCGPKLHPPQGRNL